MSGLPHAAGGGREAVRQLGTAVDAVAEALSGHVSSPSRGAAVRHFGYALDRLLAGLIGIPAPPPSEGATRPHFCNAYGQPRVARSDTLASSGSGTRASLGTSRRPEVVPCFWQRGGQSDWQSYEAPALRVGQDGRSRLGDPARSRRSHGWDTPGRSTGRRRPLEGRSESGASDATTRDSRCRIDRRAPRDSASAVRSILGPVCSAARPSHRSST